MNRKPIHPHGLMEKFLRSHSSAGLLLLLCAGVALILANSPWAGAYYDFWHQKLSLQVGTFKLSNTLLHWVNDGLMALFFFAVGLELKKELMAGDLSTPKKALLPLAAALGGMLVPAGIFLLWNPGYPESRGWGIPMATDIAFALGILALLGSRVPTALKVFVTALAIADDLGAVLVIAFFYTSQIDLINLCIGLGLLGFLFAANLLGVRNSLFYGTVGVLGIWLAFLSSGIHASIAGVLIAFTIPARPRISEKEFTQRLNTLNQEFQDIPPNQVSLLEKAQVEVLDKIHDLTRQASTPLQTLEHSFGPFVLFIIMPIFALGNAAVPLNIPGVNPWLSGVSWGVFMGLVLGKILGILGASLLVLKLGLAQLPVGVKKIHLVGAGFIGGVGFTMSLFVTSLAYGDSPEGLMAKVGILLGSLTAGLLGFLVLYGAGAKKHES